jgi:hypothetical protein
MIAPSPSRKFQIPDSIIKTAAMIVNPIAAPLGSLSAPALSS